MGELVSLRGINLSFRKKSGGLRSRRIHVLKDIDLTLNTNEILAVVGESGCGKTTLGKLVTGLLKPDYGEIVFEGKSVSGFLEKKRSSYSGVQFVQQDSYAALNPVRTIYQSLSAPIKTHNPHMSKRLLNERIDELMQIIGLWPSDQYLEKYPHQLSGGQRQRILIARAVSLNPKLIVADEPVSMIDVSLRLSLLSMMADINKRLNISFIYITHDLSTARYIAQNGRLCVMYLGEIVEIGPMEQILTHPRHPYTQALISSVPVPDPAANNDKDVPLKSMDLASLENRGEGCSFYSRCLYSKEACTAKIDNRMEGGVLIRCINLENVP